MSERNSLRDFANVHRGETIIVCGCGVSLNELPLDYTGVTIGVNDVGRRFDPTYLVVLNPRQQFKADRFKFVERSGVKALFTQLNLGIAHPHIVRFRLGERGGTDLSRPDVLPYARNSTYVALCLALFMGARRIGLIGVDFTDNHFFARTGRHALAPEIDRINAEFAALGTEARARGVEIVNLSEVSRVNAFPKAALAQLEMAGTGDTARPVSNNGSVFFVHYRFKTCGDVFSTGLEHAAADLGVRHASAYWDDAALDRKIANFDPDLLFVVHGRQFVKKWGRRIRHRNTALWLLDEPYEVDDSAVYSQYFDTVFVNDYATLERHRNAHYLPVAFDPHVHRDRHGFRDLDVGFIGGPNATRERLLEALREVGHLSYVVGSGWRSKGLQHLCIAKTLPPDQVAHLYQRTRIVINVFRDRHHFNARKIAAQTLNPRIYEALACGALVITEHRPGVRQAFPDMSIFTGEKELLDCVEGLKKDASAFQRLREDCTRRLAAHSYEKRLEQVLGRCLKQATAETVTRPGGEPTTVYTKEGTMTDVLPTGWSDYGGVTAPLKEQVLRIEMTPDESPGAERGLVSDKAYRDVTLSFRLRLGPEACFIAKIHQGHQRDQTSNSYHLMCRPELSYLGMHHRVLARVSISRDVWHEVVLQRARGRVELRIDGRQLYSQMQRELDSGYAFLGVKGGAAELRDIALSIPGESAPRPSPARAEIGYRVLRDFKDDFTPRLSIVTTVYDRVQCLANCIESVRGLHFRDFEHIIVADHPPTPLLRQIEEVLEAEDNPRGKLMNLERRYNNWGIAPAESGLRVARGEYLCFLSDDNGYLPEHFGPLTEVLDRNPRIGFAYSSCKYDGRLVLRHSIPRPGAIDLGQPMFRLELFDRYLDGGLPFDMMAWDWHMIKHFMDRGVKWRHVNRETFLFRLAKYQPLQGTGT